MAGERMDVDREVAEKQLKSLDHSEQHYFNSYNHHGERHSSFADVEPEQVLANR